MANFAIVETLGAQLFRLFYPRREAHEPCPSRRRPVTARHGQGQGHSSRPGKPLGSPQDGPIQDSPVCHVLGVLKLSQGAMFHEPPGSTFTRFAKFTGGFPTTGRGVLGCQGSCGRIVPRTSGFRNFQVHCLRALSAAQSCCGRIVPRTSWFRNFQVHCLWGLSAAQRCCGRIVPRT